MVSENLPSLICFCISTLISLYTMIYIIYKKILLTGRSLYTRGNLDLLSKQGGTSTRGKNLKTFQFTPCTHTRVNSMFTRKVLGYATLNSTFSRNFADIRETGQFRTTLYATHHRKLPSFADPWHHPGETAQFFQLENKTEQFTPCAVNAGHISCKRRSNISMYVGCTYNS